MNPLEEFGNDFEDYLKEAMKDPAFRAEWERLGNDPGELDK